MEIRVLTRKGDIPERISVEGASVVTTSIEHSTSSGPVTYDLELTLNGVYNRTPANIYNRVHNPKQGNQLGDRASLGYQVILFTRPARAEFQIFKLHDNPVINKSRLGYFNISEDKYDTICFGEPEEICASVQSQMFPDVPQKVAQFLLNARRCTSN